MSTRVEAWLQRAAAARPDHPALVTPASTLTYAELLDAATRAELPAGRGEHVGLALPPGEAFAVALHACLLRGAVAVPIDPRLGDAQRAAREARCAAVVDEPLPAAPEPTIERSPPHSDGDPPILSGDRPQAPQRGSVHALQLRHELAAPALVVHTSGSTGPGRPVTLTYGNWLWSALGASVALGHPRDERWLCALPLSHVGGLSILLRAAIGATTAIVHERFEIQAVLAELRRPGGPTAVSLVPTTLQRLLDAGLRRPPALRTALVGGAPVPARLVERAWAAGVPVTTTYGLTEACSQVATAGAPLFCTRVRLAADGEILVRGPTVAPGAAGPDGWLRTGDLGELACDGTLRVTGRAAETIVTGGENVAPGEVEAVLGSHPAVAQAAVHGRPHPEWGEAVVATVVLRAPATPQELRAHCAAHLAPHQVPKAIAFAPALPRTPSGKLRRGALGDAAGGATVRAPVGSTPGQFQTVSTIGGSVLTDEEANRVVGSTLVSAQGEELGEVESVLTHAADHRAAWALSTVAGRSVAVPLDGARTEGGRLVVRYDSERISSAPGVEADALDAQAAQRLYDHYGIDDATLREDSGIATEEASGGVGHRTGDPRGGAGADDRAQGHP